MNLRKLITPKNEDGSIDHRYVPIAKAIAELAGERVEAQLRKLFDRESRGNNSRVRADVPFCSQQALFGCSREFMQLGSQSLCSPA